MTEKKININLFSVLIFTSGLLVLSIDKIFLGLKFLYFKISSLDLSFGQIQELDFISGFLFSLIFIIVTILFVLNYCKLLKLKLFEKLTLSLKKVNTEFLIGIDSAYFLIVITLTAPVISPDNPSFHKDIQLTKFLKPLGSVKYVKLKSKEGGISEIEKIKKILFENFNEENRIYFEEMKVVGSSVHLFKNMLIDKVSIDEIENENGEPKIYSKVFLLGTDEFGRDLLSRIIYGIRISFFIGILSVLVSFLLGGLIGYSAGIFGGFIDNLLMRMVDFFLSFPILFFVIFLIAFFGNSILLLILVFGFSGWMFIARLARNETLACMKKEFVQTLILAGQKKFKIVLNHILPNTFAPILITLIFQFSNVVIAESALSFLGLGVQPPTPTLGGIIKTGYDYFSSASWISFSSGFALIIIVLTFNLIGEGLKKSELK
jgi:peptide/nickel transport system permease protein